MSFVKYLATSGPSFIARGLVLKRKHINIVVVMLSSLAFFSHLLTAPSQEFLVMLLVGCREHKARDCM